MRTNLARVKRGLAAALSASGPSVEVTLRWVEVTGSQQHPMTVDLVTGAHAGGTRTTKTATARCLWHEVGPASSGVRMYAEVEIGNVIADFAGDVALDGKQDLQVELDGEVWVPKNVSGDLAKAWDVRAGGLRIRSLLLRKA